MGNPNHLDILSSDIEERWAALCADQHLQDMPFKIEIDERGHVQMSPASIWHSQIQSIIITLLQEIRGKLAFPECAIRTSNGVKVADVVWADAAWLAEQGSKKIASAAPTICVEIMSDSNTLAEMETKRDEYFEAGCEEFILVDLKGFVTFFSPSGQLDASVAAAGFPARVEV